MLGKISIENYVQYYRIPRGVGSYREPCLSLCEDNNFYNGDQLRDEKAAEKSQALFTKRVELGNTSVVKWPSEAFLWTIFGSSRSFFLKMS